MFNSNEQIKESVWMFLFSFGIVFAFSLFFFWILYTAFPVDEGEDTDMQTVALSEGMVVRPPTVLPTRVIIETAGIDAPIVHPQSRDVAVLDAALKEGAVHYPGSGKPGEDTNMFLFGHSTNWDIVQNPAYRSFNNLDTLKAGDIIRVQSEGWEYLYAVDSVTLADAEDAWVEISKEKKLFISTCNTFGKKSERFVVEASLFASYERANI